MPQWLSLTAVLHGSLFVMVLQVYREEAGGVVMMVTSIDMFASLTLFALIMQADNHTGESQLPGTWCIGEDVGTCHKER